jgi:hypothetical protein
LPRHRRTASSRDQGQISFAPVADVKEVAKHLHALALLTLPEQSRHRHAKQLTEQVEQRGFQRGDRVDSHAQIEGLQAAPARVAVGEASAHRVEDSLVVTDALADRERARVLQRLTNALAAGHRAEAGVACAVLEDNDVAREKGAVRAAQIQQHAVTSGDRYHLQFCDAGSGVTLARSCGHGDIGISSGSY